MKVGIVISTFRRTDQLQLCLSSISENVNYGKANKLFVMQNLNSQAQSIINNFTDKKTSLISIDGKDRTAIQNINHNYWNGLSILFNFHECDYVLMLEDDTVVSNDVLSFIDYIFAKYSEDKKFRGINLSSIETFPDKNDTFSKLRFGIHGYGWVIPFNTWKRMDNFLNRWLLKGIAFDSLFEHYCKTGFMITPNLSKMKNSGWMNGTHVTESARDFYYEIEKSFQIGIERNTGKYNLNNINPKFREDCIVYNSRDNLYFNFKYIVNLLHFIRLRNFYIRSQKSL